MKKIFIPAIAAILAILTSCASNSLTVQVLKPAEITVPVAIKKVVVLNRSLPDDDSKLGNIIEGVLTGEGIFVDREASERCLTGLSEFLASQPRFEVAYPTNLDLRGTGTSKWPEPMNWGDVKVICKQNGADAVVALETFDSDQGVRIADEVRKQKNSEGVTVDVPIKVAHLDIAIHAGWRIYFLDEKRVIDQNVYVDHMHFDAEGSNPDKARDALPNRRLAIRDAGYYAGKQYGFRISPAWVNVSRSYYVKGNDDFVDAKYKARSNSWKEAAAIWQKHVNDPDPKIAGRATYNMAVACEIEGNLVAALDWAKKSYNDHHNKKAREYIRIIEQRISDQKRLQEQMGGQ